ncbi:hypothetical protein OSB04_016785 [Centaurea solstitialis]|uniref:Reverse transcriptase RNase H-like domain-containing protein n=1 Tax=Centaurea solstitialis TaxID=347529 RepID=A0AA38WHS8_9ASTR|nr:hypothetical protein OSB04_016785 [Centaurea solstitialis]
MHVGGGHLSHLLLESIQGTDVDVEASREVSSSCSSGSLGFSFRSCSFSNSQLSFQLLMASRSSLHLMTKSSLGFPEGFLSRDPLVLGFVELLLNIRHLELIELRLTRSYFLSFLLRLRFDAFGGRCVWRGDRGGGRFSEEGFAAGEVSNGLDTDIACEVEEDCGEHTCGFWWRHGPVSRSSAMVLRSHQDNGEGDVIRFWKNLVQGLGSDGNIAEGPICGIPFLKTVFQDGREESDVRDDSLSLRILDSTEHVNEDTLHIVELSILDGREDHLLNGVGGLLRAAEGGIEGRPLNSGGVLCDDPFLVGPTIVDVLQEVQKLSPGKNMRDLPQSADPELDNLIVKLEADHVLNDSLRVSFDKSLENQVEKIKEYCKVLPKLQLPKDNDDLILETDASENYWSGVLKKIDYNSEQKKIGENICRYCSGTFTDTQTRYHINEKELLAVVKSCQKFYYFLLPKNFLLRTDNTQVKAFIKNNLPFKPEYKRLIRWQILLSEYNFDIEIIKSDKNVLADFLTRDGKDD